MKPVITKVIIITDRRFWCVYLGFHIMRIQGKCNYCFWNISCVLFWHAHSFAPLGMNSTRFTYHFLTKCESTSSLKLNRSTQVPFFLAEMRELKLEYSYIRSLWMET